MTLNDLKNDLKTESANTIVNISKERTHLFAPNINVSTKVDIIGNPSDDKLSDAIKRAVMHNEILSCKIMIEPNGDAYYFKLDDPVLSISILNTNSLDDWKQVIKQQETCPFHIDQGELIRFFILKNKETTQLLIVAHHLAGDGLSFSYLVEDIMNSLSSSASLSYKPIQLYDSSVLPKGSRLNPVTRMMLKSLNRKWKKNGKAFTLQDSSRLFQAYWNNRSTDFLCEVISDTNCNNILQKSKKYGIKVNSIITTAFLKSISEKLNIGLTVNLRPDHYKGMGNYATGISIEYTYDDTIDFFMNAKKVEELIYIKLNSDKHKYFLTQFMGALEPTLIDAVYFSAFSDYKNKVSKTMQTMFGYNDNPNAISISNLTKLNINSQYGNYGITNYVVIPPVVANAKRMIGVATLGNSMSISMNMLKDESYNESCDFFEKAMKILNEI